MTANNREHRDEKGRFTSSNPGKPIGSKKNLIRDSIRAFINSKIDDLPEWFETLKPKEKIDALLSLMPYAVSRLSSIDLQESENENQTKAAIDYSNLSEGTLKEILQNTYLDENDLGKP